MRFIDVSNDLVGGRLGKDGIFDPCRDGIALRWRQALYRILENERLSPLIEKRGTPDMNHKEPANAFAAGPGAHHFVELPGVEFGRMILDILELRGEDRDRVGNFQYGFSWCHKLLFLF